MENNIDKEEDPLAELLEITTDVKPVKVINPDTDAEEYAEANIKEALGTAKDALDEIWSLAQQSQHPRMFEKFTELFAQIVDANHKLIDMKRVAQVVRDKKMLSNKDNQPNNNGNVINNLFVGTTKDFQEMLAQAREAKKNGQ